MLNILNIVNKSLSLPLFVFLPFNDYATPFLGVNFTSRVNIEVMHGICFC